MICWMVQKLLPLHAGSDLPKWMARRLSQHIPECDGCGRALALTVRAIGSVRELASVDHTGPEVVELVEEAIRNGRGMKRRPPTLGWGTGVRAACAVLLAGACSYVITAMPFETRALEILDFSRTVSEVRRAGTLPAGAGGKRAFARRLEWLTALDGNGTRLKMRIRALRSAAGRAGEDSPP